MRVRVRVRVRVCVRARLCMCKCVRVYVCVCVCACEQWRILTNTYYKHGPTKIPEYFFYKLEHTFAAIVLLISVPSFDVIFILRKYCVLAHLPGPEVYPVCSTCAGISLNAAFGRSDANQVDVALTAP